jgi:5-(carboxyamino)imidazole ribonucleotide synthase
MKKIGIIGGGQLGKMMALAAKYMNFYIITLDPAASCPSHSISDELITAGFDDEAAIADLARRSDVITYEFEHIDAQFLLRLEKQGYHIYPTPRSLIDIQDKLTQNEKLREGGAPVPDFLPVETPEQLKAAGEQLGYPLMLKARFGGYDGKGNFALRSADDIQAAFAALAHGKAPARLMAEKWVDFAMEISVLACRGIDGDIKVYPAAENIHAESILRKTIAPARIEPQAAQTAMDVAARVMDIFQGVGMFGTEMFVTKDGGILVNEVAPRPHNSGHFTIEACVTSQFANHIRAVAGLPLGETTMNTCAVMENILGEAGFEGPANLLGMPEALAVPGVSVHLYGKADTKPKRKMGHITALAENVPLALSRADKAMANLRMVSI